MHLVSESFILSVNEQKIEGIISWTSSLLKFINIKLHKKDLLRYSK